jgi:hypothetical protein
MRKKPQNVPWPRRLPLVISIAACLSLAGCRLFAPRDESPDDDTSSSTKFFRWFEQLRDERALEVERHMSGG